MGQADPVVIKRAEELGVPSSVAETQFLLMLAEGTDGAVTQPAVDEGEGGDGEKPLVPLESDIDAHRLMDVHLHRCVLRCNAILIDIRTDARTTTTLMIPPRQRGAMYPITSHNRLHPAIPHSDFT